MSTFDHFNNNDETKKKIGMHKLLSMKREKEKEFKLHYYFDKNRIRIQFRDTQNNLWMRFNNSENVIFALKQSELLNMPPVTL